MSAAISASARAVSGVRIGGLEDDRVAGRQRRADLPAGHVERVVPGRDRRHHADRVAADERGVAGQVLVGGLALDDPRRTREEAQVVDHGRDLVAGRPSGLPPLRLSSPPSSSARASTASARRSSMRLRSWGVLCCQVSKAAAAAAAARSTSSASEAGTVAMTPPVAGLVTSAVRPLALATHRPPIHCCRASTSVTVSATWASSSAVPRPAVPRSVTEPALSMRSPARTESDIVGPTTVVVTVRAPGASAGRSRRQARRGASR